MGTVMRAVARAVPPPVPRLLQMDWGREGPW